MLTWFKQGTSHSWSCKASSTLLFVAGDRRPLFRSIYVFCLPTQPGHDGVSTHQVMTWKFWIICKWCFHRLDFAQPGHVLQVAAAVAKLKAVPLKQVFNWIVRFLLGTAFASLDVRYIIPLLQVLLANLRNISEIYGVPTSRQDWNYIWEVKYMMRPPLDMPELFLKRDYSPQ